LFLFNLASPDGRPYSLYPKHYLSQFMKKYNTTNLDQLIEENGAADWVELFRKKGGTIPGTPYDATWQNTELPNLLGYVLVEPSDGGTRMLVQRNPYYWKIDPEGNQLPYIDAVDYTVMQDAEVLLLKAVSGEIDVHYRHIMTTINKPVLADGQESGNYQLYDTIRGDMNDVMIGLNLTHKDPLTREILGNHDFRVALSHAINRQEIIDTVYTSQGEPWQAAPLPDTSFFNETLAKQYTEYDVAKANEMLDAILPDKDSDGWRLRSDGSPLVILVDVSSGGVSSPVDQMNLVVGYWQEVGIQAQLNVIDRSLLYTRKDANDHDCAVWYGNAGSQFGAYIDPRWYFPFSNEALYAIPWAYWYREVTESQAPPEEPPEYVKQQIDLYKQVQATADTEEQSRIFTELLKISQEQFYCIGIVKPGPGYGLVHNRVVNVPNPMPEEYIWPTPAPSNPEQYFIRETTA
jgi:peptide/nickel transport system substrate-binding protein